ncbi:MAG: biopolymer transporter ExbD [Tepidisphaeraceae bacterium]|jgi:biopolymer transport protein ExbD
MPVKLNAKLPTESAEARIEIIPLIDIMFFLLASFMLVSLTMVNLKSLKLNLPTAVTAQPQTKKDFLDISVDKAGAIFLDQRPVQRQTLPASLAAALQSNPQIRILISGDRDARHGDVIRVLDVVRAAGIDKVAFEIRPAQQGATP